MGRYNTAANKLGVVWHERNPIDETAEIFYSYKPCDPGQCNGYGWNTKKRVDDAATGSTLALGSDQFQPAIDFDTTGNQVVSFLDRRLDPANPSVLIDEYMAYIQPNGNPVHANVRVSTCHFHPEANGGINSRFMGDYHGVWDWQFMTGERYDISWPGRSLDVPNCASAAPSEIHLTKIIP